MTIEKTNQESSRTVLWICKNELGEKLDGNMRNALTGIHIRFNLTKKKTDKIGHNQISAYAETSCDTIS